MDILFGLLFALFVALLIFTAITFGLVIISVMAAGMAVAGLMLAAQYYWRRWRFLRTVRQDPNAPKIIDVDYIEISKKEDR